MAIKIQCPSCGASLSAPDSYHGKRIKCPRCNNRLTALTEQERQIDQHKREMARKEKERQIMEMESEKQRLAQLLEENQRRGDQSSAQIRFEVRVSPALIEKRAPKVNHSLRAIGNVEPVCPHCNQRLDKKPGRKKDCPHCGEFIFVRTRPCDNQRVLVTEAQAEEIEEQWSIVNGTHDDYLARKEYVARENARLAKRFACEPSDKDVKPICPYCRVELMERKPPKRQSAFRCPSCSEWIYVDLTQYVYPTLYLTDQQSGYVRILWRLAACCLTRSNLDLKHRLPEEMLLTRSREDYEQMRLALRKRFGCEPGVRDVVWGLLNQAVVDSAAKYNKEVADTKRIFCDDPETAKQLTSDSWELDRVRELMNEFRELEKDITDAKKERAQGEYSPSKPEKDEGVK